ncbi:MAG: hypothetical protein PQJ61_07565 [Spirochaetales bacterium]|uniref:Uncharacterized protein n=1 Tax=Candidatus Thalassospirochaeta sargassi TaxID=3119039 RepID=A0AAJ1MJK0_9SPIO|nr:hypothetical protein [Spirochaetales bacterium]
MDLGRIGLFVVVGGASLYYGLSQGRTSMMLIGIVIAAIGILNAVIQGRNKKDDKDNK